ncbi:MAG: hypothetical protein WA152_03745 [Microgenomates group bacterium]
MKAELLIETLSIITCNRCKTVIAQDTGNPADVPIIINAVNSHLATPNTFLGEIEHEILTVDAITDGSATEGLQFKKRTYIA